MAKKYYLPKTDAELDEWLDNFKKNFTTIALQLGIARTETTTVNNKIQKFKDSLNKVYNEKAKLKTIVGKKDDVKEGLLYLMLPVIQRMKNHPRYKESNHGKLLGIIGAEETIDWVNIKPTLKSKIDAGRPLIKWNKGPSEGINIYVDRKDGLGFLFLAMDTKPDYIDTEPVPESKEAVVWDYYGMSVVNDEEVGKVSDTISVTVTRRK